MFCAHLKYVHDIACNGTATLRELRRSSPRRFSDTEVLHQLHKQGVNLAQSMLFQQGTDPLLECITEDAPTAVATSSAARRGSSARKISLADFPDAVESSHDVLVMSPSMAKTLSAPPLH